LGSTQIVELAQDLVAVTAYLFFLDDVANLHHCRIQSLTGCIETILAAIPTLRICPFVKLCTSDYLKTATFVPDKVHEVNLPVARKALYR
jgi:hypothetical protein